MSAEAATEQPRPALLQARAVTRSFPAGGLPGLRRHIRILHGIDLTVSAGEVVGVVGESGCGKSTLARVLMNLLPASSGSVLFDGQDTSRLRSAELKKLRKRMQMVFQDPYGSLDPRREVGAQIADGMRIHQLAPAGEINARVAALLSQVGLEAEHAGRLPHQFSGGQRQRVAIARALATAPDLIIADEPVSALDVSVQAQIVNLLSDLRTELGLAMIFISHDLHVVRHLCDRVIVMYLGRVVEEGPVEDVFSAPVHPYTRALIAATPTMHRAGRRAPLPQGELPGHGQPLSGCAFRARCAWAEAPCADQTPPLEFLEGGARKVACLRARELAAS